MKGIMITPGAASLGFNGPTGAASDFRTVVNDAGGNVAKWVMIATDTPVLFALVPQLADDPVANNMALLRPEQPLKLYQKGNAAWRFREFQASGAARIVITPLEDQGA